jgi:hypothetical protein
MKRIVFFFLCFALALHARIALDPNVNKDRMVMGEEFELHMDVLKHDLQNYTPREIPQIKVNEGFQFLGLDSIDTYVQNFFDRYPVRRYIFKLKAPKKTGKQNIGSVTWNIQGSNYTVYPSLGVTIHRSFDSPAVTVSLSPNKKTVYEGEQFSVTIAFHTYEHFAGSLTPKSMDLGNDFIIHRSDLSNLDFKPIPNSRELQASAKFAWLSPTKSGTLNIPSFTFNYTKQGAPKIVEEKKSNGGFSMSFKSVKQETEEAEASTTPVSIKVLPLPPGAPQDFSSMVGNYSFKAEIDKDTLKVGEALTLSISIKGDGKPGTITDPKLPDFQEFRSVPPETNIQKKILNGKTITSKDIKIFLYPKRKGSFEIPEISYSWFNPSKKKYETAKAGPFKIEVEKGDASNEIQSTSLSTPLVQTKQEIETLGSDIRFIKSVPLTTGALKIYKLPSILAFILLPIPFYFVLIFIWKRHRKNQSDLALLRQRNASKNYKATITLAEKALQTKDSKSFYAALESALIGYLSDKTNLEFRGMLRNTRETALRENKVSEENISKIESWLEKCSAGRFLPMAADTENNRVLQDFRKFVSGLEV